MLAAQVEQIHRRDSVVRRLRRLVLDEAVAAVLTRCRTLRQRAHLDLAERFEHTATRIIFSQFLEPENILSTERRRTSRTGTSVDSLI